MVRAAWSMVVCLLVGSVASEAEVIVAGFDGMTPAISAYAGVSDGDEPPLRRIEGVSTQLEFTSSPAIDTGRDEVYLAHTNPPRLLVFDLGATGDAAPLRVVEGNATGIVVPVGVAVDPVHGEVFFLRGVAPNHVLVFPRTASGDVAPSRTLTLPTTTVFGPKAIVYDAVHEELIVAVEDSVTGPAIHVFDRLASGTATPLRSITGPTTVLAGVFSLAYDSTHDELFVVQRNFSTPTPTYAVHAFAGAANGTVSPLRTLSGTTAFPNARPPQYIAYDAARDELVIDSNVELRFYDRTANGNIAPLRILGGPMAGVDGVNGLVMAPDRVFEDGFESGDTTVWSLAVP